MGTIVPLSLGLGDDTEASMYQDELADWRAERDEYFASHYASPLSDEAMAKFAGLRYFPPDASLVFQASIDLDSTLVSIVSSTGSTLDYPAYGRVTVPFAGRSVVLRVLRGEEDELFIPFRDATSGSSTYSGGRYVGVERGAGERVTIDFNKSTNPYCAYDPDFSCPLPPVENWLQFAIAAGELDYP
jgi:hypothetical protein